MEKRPLKVRPLEVRLVHKHWYFCVWFESDGIFANFADIWRIMFNFIKNSLRRRALRGVKPFNGVKQEFPHMERELVLGFLCKVENMADVDALIEMVRFLKECGRLGGAVLEGKKCFRSSAARTEFEEFCKAENILFLPKGCADWKGIPQNTALADFYIQERDLMITLNPDIDFTLDYIAAGSASRFTTAVHSSNMVPYNLVLEPGKDSLSFKEYVEKLLGYIGKMQQ